MDIENNLQNRIQTVAALNIPTSRKTVLMFLHFHVCNENSTPTGPTLARETCLSIRTVRRALQDLKLRGIIHGNWGVK
ncbi:MAG TPA: hypothetical protein ENI27_00960 [bacterium]|nr:hypothetical protein [bacterium]